MTNKRTTKRSLVLSFMALLLCAAMFVGTTYAWFTDSVTSGNNIIKSGNLDVEMYWLEGNEDPTATDGWEDASKGAIFNNTNWEPGRTEAKHIKIANVGSLAFNYQMRIVANGTVSKLADVIDVYYFAGGKQLTRDDATTGTYLGTLAEVMGTDKNLVKTVAGMLEAGKDVTTTLALKMRESAGNEYQNLSIGTDFSIELIATQASFESDSFGNNYDAAAPSPEVPAALVRALDDLDISYTLGIGGSEYEGTLDAGYQFEPTISYDDAQNSLYRYWHADFVVKADKDVPAESMALAGYYDAWCSLNNDNWVALTADTAITAGTEIRLVELLGATVNWEEICNYGNDGLGFQCGLADLSENGVNTGTTVTVELRLYETTKAWDATSGTANEETGEYIIVGVFEYTFGGKSISTADELVAAMARGGNYKLTDDITVDIAETGFNVPKDVSTKLDLNGHDIIATSTSAESVQLFSVSGNLEIVGEGKISLTNPNYAWTTSYRYTAINIRETGVVTLGEGVEVVCTTGENTENGYGMTYAVDIYTTGTLNVNGASLHSNYIAVRCFYGASVVNFNSGSITSSRNNWGIWPQSAPNAVITIANGITYTTDTNGIYIFD